MLKNLVEKYDKKVHRFLEILPGFLTWSLLLSPVWLGLLFPQAIIFFLTFLTVFWFYLGIKFTYGAFKGFGIYQQELKVKWYEKVKELDFKNLPVILIKFFVTLTLKSNNLADLIPVLSHS